MAEEKGGKSVVFLNHTKNPFMVKDVAGKVVRVLIGESVEVSEEKAASLRKITGFVDAAKYQRPSSQVDSMKAKIVALERENAGLKADLAKAKKDK